MLNFFILQFCVLQYLHVAHFFRVALFSGCNFSVSYFFHLVLFACCTIVRAAPFSCCTFFVLHSFFVELLLLLNVFHVALFSMLHHFTCCTFLCCTIFCFASCCTHFMLHFFHAASSSVLFHVALLLCRTHFELQNFQVMLFCLVYTFCVALFSFCTIFE